MHINCCLELLSCLYYNVKLKYDILYKKMKKCFKLVYCVIMSLFEGQYSWTLVPGREVYMRKEFQFVISWSCSCNLDTQTSLCEDQRWRLVHTGYTSGLYKHQKLYRVSHEEIELLHELSDNHAPFHQIGGLHLYINERELCF